MFIEQRRSPHERSDMRDCGLRTCASLIEVDPAYRWAPAGYACYRDLVTCTHGSVIAFALSLHRQVLK
jgi:hypothetical protein